MQWDMGSHKRTVREEPRCLARSAKHEQTSWPFSKLAHVSELIILERLLDFRAVVHHEWAFPDDGFCDRFAVHHQEFGVGFRFYGDAGASASKDCQVTFTCITLAVHRDLAAQYEKRSCVSVGQWKFRRLACTKIHVPQIDWREG